MGLIISCYPVGAFVVFTMFRVCTECAGHNMVDRALWINHLRSSNSYLSKLLYDEKVLIHSCVVGELACGSLKNRSQFLELLVNLPRSLESDSNEVLKFISSNK